MTQGKRGVFQSQVVARDKAEEERERVLATLDAVLSSMVAGVATYDTSGRITFLNPAGERMLGYLTGLTGASVQERVAAARVESPEGVALSVAETPAGRALRGETVTSMTMRVHRPDGAGWWMLASAAPMRSPDGVILGAAVTFLDVTEQCEADEERERLHQALQDQHQALQSQAEEIYSQNEELRLAMEELARATRLAKAAVRDRDEFLSVAAHELKTPVTSLRGYAQALLRQMEKGDAVDRSRLALALAQIDRQSARLSSLVNQLLDLSRIEAGRLCLEKEETDISSLVEGVVAAHRQLVPQRTVLLSVQRRVTAPADPLRLEQVIANLLDNATKFSPREAPIEVRVGAVGEAAQIVVRDHGIGIPAAKRPRIFERFYQAHEEEWHGGMGLGLFISSQIVELHGGKITADEPAGGGARFVVQLPLGGEAKERGGNG